MERQSTRKLFKLVIALVALFTLALSVFAFGACGGEEHKHEYTGSNKSEATCGQIGVETFTCSCGDTYVVVTPATGKHKWDANGQYCETCGLPNFGAEKVTIPDGFTASDLDAIKAAITASEGNLTDAQKAAHDALGQKIDGLNTHPVHTFSTDNVKTLTLPGTCTSYGVKFTLSTCDVCKATFLTNIDKDGTLGHTPGEKQVVEEPTCKDFGYWKITCTVCGTVINEGDINVKPHDHDVKSDQSIEATCTTTGLDVFECSMCGEVQPQWNQVTGLKPHTQPEGAKPADCTTAQGKFTYECEVCHQSITVDFNKSAHEWVYSDFQQVECGKTATVTQSCANCQVTNELTVTSTDTAIIAEINKQLGANTWKAEHDLDTSADKTYSNFVLTADDNRKLGCDETTPCKNCTTGKTEFVNHNWTIDLDRNDEDNPRYSEDDVWGEPVGDLGIPADMQINGYYNPYCYQDAYIYFYCVDSGHAEDDPIKTYALKLPRAEHTLKAVTVVTAMDCGKGIQGYAYQICETCEKGYALTDAEKAKTGKELADIYKAKAAADTNLYFKEIVTEVAHTLGDVDYTGEGCKAPTCTEDGIGIYTCTVCNKKLPAQTIEGSALGHNYADDAWKLVYDEDPSNKCLATNETNTCTRCGEVATRKRNVTNPVEHTYVIETVNQPATCTEYGETTYVCTRCGETSTKKTAPLGHLWATPEGVVDEFNNHWSDVRFTKPATCTENGYTGYWCVRRGCGVHSGPEIKGSPYVVLPAAHTFEKNADGSIKEYVTKAKCEEDGKIEYKCTVCGELVLQEVLPALDHDYRLYIYDCTREADPYNGYYCVRCNPDYGNKKFGADHAKKYNQTVGFLTLAQGKAMGLKTPEITFGGPHELTLGDFEQGTLCGSDATYTITCAKCHMFQDDGGDESKKDGIFVLTAAQYDEMKTKNDADEKEWKDILDFLKASGYRRYHDFATPVGTATYVLKQFVKDEEWEKLNPKEGDNTVKTSTFKCACGAETLKSVTEQHTWSGPVYEQNRNSLPDAVKKWLTGKDLPDDTNDVLWDGSTYHLKVHHNVTLYWYCNDTSCVNKPLIAEYVVEWNGQHDWTGSKWDATWTQQEAVDAGWTLVEDDAGKTPTCKDGVRYERHCTHPECEDVADAHETQVWTAPHAWTEWTWVVKSIAHLDQAGEKVGTRKCTVCEKEETETVITPATGKHIWTGEWEVLQEASCTNPGVAVMTCAYPGCSVTISVNTPATGHTFEMDGDDYVIYRTPATCDSNGDWGYKCVICGQYVVQGYTPAHGHWYYDISIEAAAGMSKDELERDHLNVVGGFESSCLAPEGQTVECYYCKVRYNLGGDAGKFKGHKWILIPETDNDGVQCGEFKNSMVLAYCEQCGLVIDVTDIKYEAVKSGSANEITFTDYNIYAKYLGIEDLDKEQLAALKALLDDNNNLNLKSEVVNPDKEPVEGKPVNYTLEELIGLVVKAFKSEEIQLHKFVKTDDYKVMLQSDGCEGDAAWVYVCSICGVREATAEEATNDAILKTVGGKVVTIKADTVLDHKDAEGNVTLSYQKYLSDYTAAKYGSKPEGYKALGYTQITKTNDVTVTGSKTKTSLYKLYNELVAKIVPLAEGETFHVPSSFYTWYNFAAFAYQNGNHNFLNGDSVVECQIDPILQMLLEDFVGTQEANAGENKILIRDNKPGVSKIVADIFANEKSTFANLVDGNIGWCIGDAKAIAAFKTTYAAWLTKPMKDYKVVVDYLQANCSSYPDALKALVKSGVRDWCKNSTADPVCPLANTKAEGCTYGFVATVPHANQYKIYKTENGKKINETFDFVFTFDPETEWVAPKSKKEIESFNKTKVGWDEDLRFIQYLYELQKDAEKNAATLALFDDYVNEEDGMYKDAIQYVVVSDKTAPEITCMVCMVCKYCGLVTPNNTHVKADDNSPEDKMNCQHGDRCVACGESRGIKGDHNLMDAFTLTGTLKTAYEELCKKNTTFVSNDCWNGIKELKICVGCLEAWYNDGKCDGANWVKPTGTGVVNGWLAKTSSNDGNYTKVIAKNMDEVNLKHTFVVEQKNLASLIEKLGLKPTTAAGAATPTPLTIADVEKAILALFGEVKTVEEQNVVAIETKDAQGTKIGDLKLYFNAEHKLVLESELLPEEGYCKGERYKQNLCVVCAIENKGFGDNIAITDLGATKGVKNGSAYEWQWATAPFIFGVENASMPTNPAAAGTYTKPTEQEGYNAGKYENYAQLVHVYALAKDPNLEVEDGIYRVTTVCLRCKETYRGLWTDLEESHKKGGYVFAKSEDELDDATASNGCKIDDYEALQKAWNELAYTDAGHPITYTVGGVKELTDDRKNLGSGYFTLDSTEPNKTVTFPGGLLVNEGAEVVIDVADGVNVEFGTASHNGNMVISGNTVIKLGEGATLKVDSGELEKGTTVFVGENATLTIEGGVLDLTASKEKKNGSIGVKGDDAKLELIDTVVYANSAIQAESGGEIVFTRVKAYVDYAIAISTNNALTDPNVTYTITDSEIVSTGDANIGLLINSSNAHLKAEGSLFYGLCVGAWVRAGDAEFTDCTFVSGGVVSDRDEWADGTGYKGSLTAALLVGDGKGTYGDADVKLTDCESVISYEVNTTYRTVEGNKDSNVKAGDYVKLDKETNTFTYKPYTAAETVTKMPLKFAVVAGVSGETKSTAKVTFDTTSATSFGITQSSLIKNKNVFFENNANETAIVVKIGDTPVTINPQA